MGILNKLLFIFGAVGGGIAPQTRRSRFRFPMVSLEFFINIILPVAVMPWGRAGIFSGG